MIYKNIFPFVDRPCNFEEIEKSKIYLAIKEIEENNNNKLLKDLYLSSNSYDSLCKAYYKLLGWYFDLKKYFKCYLVNFKYDNYYNYIMYYAPNKTCLYKVLGGYHLINNIIEVK